MTEFRYKAFISYSHHDAKWASWLHKSLESYRLPRQLVGRTTRYGKVPAKFYPVFRDRDELSSGASLSNRVSEALAESESLIIVCSPAAATSRWVNEEIREFRKLGRSERIYCMIVDGDPQAKDLEESCFPPALFEASVGETTEPLAADPRGWADGKVLARLKLISGILGVRLDDLRRREQIRKRVKTLLYLLAGLAGLALVLVTIFTSLQERAQRENAEMLVSQMIALSSDLDSQVDLETMRRLARQLQGYLQNFDTSDLTHESQKQVALVLRQLGRVHKEQGRLDDAMMSFNQSREVLMGLVREHPEHTDYIFELGNAEFYIADIYLERLEYTKAMSAILRYRDQAETLVALEPGNVDWIIEISSANTNLAALVERMDASDVNAALEYIGIATDYLERAMSIEPENMNFTAQYTDTLAWLSGVQLRKCDLEGAWISRITAEALARKISADQPANNRLKRDHAYRLTSLSSTQLNKGQTVAALESLKQARDILEELVRMDPSNSVNKWELHRRHALIADLRATVGETDLALESMEKIRISMINALGEGDEENLRRRSQFAEFLMDYSDAVLQSGDRPRAVSLLEEAISILEAVLQESSAHRQSLERIGMAEYRWYQLGTNREHPAFKRFAGALEVDDRGVWSCQEADLFARQAILREDTGSALEFTNYLIEKGYANPDFRAFCIDKGLCN